MTQRIVWLRAVYLAVAAVWWLAAGCGLLRSRATVVLCYHGVTAAQRRRFACQMRYLQGRAISATALPALHSPQSRLRVCLTFDDAFACLLENALPVTCDLGIPVTIFVPTSNLGRCPAWSMPPGHPEADERVMTSEEIRQVHRPALVDFGSHTCTHTSLPQQTDAALATELAASQAELRGLLGVPVEDLALPYGAYDAEVLAAAKAAGYRRIYTLEEQVVKPGQAGICGRFLMSADVWPIEFRLTCAGAYRWLFAWRRFVRRMRAWFRLAGTPNLSPT